MLQLSVLIEFCWLLCPDLHFFLVVDKVLFLPNFCYTYVKLYTDFGPALESYPDTALTMRTAFWTFPCYPVEGVILGLKGKFSNWTFRGEACMSDEGQSCLFSNSNSNESRVEFLTIFETSGMNNFNLLCFLFTFLLLSTRVPFLLCIF